MDLLIRNAEGNLTSDDREYAAKKLGRLDRYFNKAHKVELVHRQEKLVHHVEITVFADGFTVRGEEEDAHIRAAIDILAEKLENRLRKLKGRLIKSHRRKGNPLPPEIAEHNEEEEHIAIRDRRIFELQHMTAEDAATQIELIDLPFFLYRNEDTGNLEVLFKRKDGRYSLLLPEG